MTRKQRNHNAATHRHWRKVADQRIAQGLTTRGTTRKYQRHEINVIINGQKMELHGKRRNRIRDRIYLEKLHAQGLTRNHTPLFSRLTPLERQWRSERAQMDVRVKTWEDGFLDRGDYS